LYDYETVKKKLPRQLLAQNQNFTHWRYLPLLPVEKPEFIQPLTVGWTPIYPKVSLAKQFGLKSLYIKDDGRNPTASLKDRASSVAVVKALEKDCRTVTAASTGNAASSWSAFTTLAGLETVIFVPQDAPRAKLAQLLLYGAKVVQVIGNYDEAFDLCCRAAEKWGWYNRSTAINPYLGEGKKTAALEICEQLNWQMPDYVVISVGDGCIMQGMWKGFNDFARLLLIDRLPRMIGVQATGSAPLVKAWKTGSETVEPVVPETIADSIAVGVPRDQVKALRAVRESGGRFIAVTDDQILSAVSLLAKQAGVLAEPAGAAAMAGLQKLAREGILTPDDSVLVMVTGNGLKDIDGVMKAVEQKPLLVDNDISDVEEKLKTNGLSFSL
ncbi:MAG: threonine synthase, partial [Calditrichia bacterium]